MKTYEKNVIDRKVLVKRLEDLTGEKGKYSFVPRMAYLFTGCAVEKDGTLTVEEGMTMSIIDTLITEGLIKTNTLDAVENAEENDPQESQNRPEPDAGAEPEGILAESGYEQDTVTESTASLEISDDEDQAVPGCDGLIISLPLDMHTHESLRRLLNLIYTRGSLISKATGGSFCVDKDLLTALDQATDIQTKEDFIKTVEEHGGLTGITFMDGKLNFTGFPFSNNYAKTAAFQQLACAISKHVIDQKRIQAKLINTENEKYIFRVWLVRIGMDGKDCKQVRKILMEKLSGHTAFRTRADEEKWKARQAEKRQALRESKESTAGENGAGE